MDDILQFFLTVLGEFFSNVKFQNPKTRTWVLTVFVSVLAVAFVGFLVWSGADLFRQGSAAGAVVLGVLALAAVVMSIVIILRGHRKSWDNF